MTHEHEVPVHALPYASQLHRSLQLSCALHTISVFTTGSSLCCVCTIN